MTIVQCCDGCVLSFFIVFIAFFMLFLYTYVCIGRTINTETSGRCRPQDYENRICIFEDDPNQDRSGFASLMYHPSLGSVSAHTAYALLVVTPISCYQSRTALTNNAHNATFYIKFGRDFRSRFLVVFL